MAKLWTAPCTKATPPTIPVSRADSDSRAMIWCTIARKPAPDSGFIGWQFPPDTIWIPSYRLQTWLSGNQNWARNRLICYGQHSTGRALTGNNMARCQPTHGTGRNSARVPSPPGLRHWASNAWGGLWETVTIQGSRSGLYSMPAGQRKPASNCLWAFTIPRHAGIWSPPIPCHRLLSSAVGSSPLSPAIHCLIPTTRYVCCPNMPAWALPRAKSREQIIRSLRGGSWPPSGAPASAPGFMRVSRPFP